MYVAPFSAHVEPLAAHRNMQVRYAEMIYKILSSHYINFSCSFAHTQFPLRLCFQLWLTDHFTYRSRWNFKLCTIWVDFCRKFHRWSVSSAVAVTRAPSLTRNSMCVTAQADSSSCRTCMSTPGLPSLSCKFGKFCLELRKNHIRGGGGVCVCICV